MTINYDTLYRFCNDNNYFTCDSIEQYKKLFEANSYNAPVNDLTTIIRLCSKGKNYLFYFVS